MALGKGGSVGFGEEDKVLQAVVMADSFNERFMPVTLDRPRCLLPLVNIPIIEYTFEFLAVSGVQEVILFCRAHAEQIRQYLSRSRWSKPTASMHIQIIINNECMSMGDALRDIDARSIIHGDFFLVCGDVVSNMNLTEALQLHKKRRQTDKNYIMTMVLKESSPLHRARERCESGVFALDPASGECVAYECVESDACRAVTLPIPRLAGTGASLKELDIRYDLMDCQIDICSLNVLALFTENFDYQDMRRDFLRGVLTSEILGVRIATHLLTREYASRVRSPHLYDSISKDIVGRWAFPVVPEADILEEQSYVFRRGNRYLGPDVVLSRSATVAQNTVLATGVSVGEHTVIRNSVVGAHCRIGSHVVLENAYVWDYVTIDNGCRLTSCIIADRVHVKSNSTIRAGCLVTSNITLGPGADLPARTRVAKLGEHVDVAMRQLDLGKASGDGGGASGADASGSASGVGDGSSFTSRQKFLGEGSDGVVWEGSVDDAPEPLDGSADRVVQEERLAAFDMGTEKARPVFEDHHSEVDDDEGPAGELMTGISAGLDAEINQFGRDSGKFMADAFDLIRHALENDYLLDNAILELNGLKFACNATFAECRQVIVRALLAAVDGEAPQRSTEKIFERWGPLLLRFTQGIEEQIDLIEAVRMACEAHPGLERTFQHIIPILYKTDVLDEEAIITWYEIHQASNSLYIRQVSGHWHHIYCRMGRWC